MMDEGGGVRVEGERLSVKEEGSGGELQQVQIWIRIRQNDADPLDPDPDPDLQHWSNLKMFKHGNSRLNFTTFLNVYCRFNSNLLQNRPFFLSLHEFFNENENMGSTEHWWRKWEDGYLEILGLMLFILFFFAQLCTSWFQ